MRENKCFLFKHNLYAGFKLWLQRLRLACILPKHSSAVDLFLIAQPWGIPAPLPRQTHTHHLFYRCSLSFSFLPSFSISVYLLLSPLTIPLGLMFCLLCSLCGRISAVTGIQHLPLDPHPSLPLLVSGTGAGCDSAEGEWALFNISHPPVVKRYAFKEVQGRVSEL